MIAKFVNKLHVVCKSFGGLAEDGKYLFGSTSMGFPFLSGLFVSTVGR